MLLHEYKQILSQSRIRRTFACILKRKYRWVPNETYYSFHLCETSSFHKHCQITFSEQNSLRLTHPLHCKHSHKRLVKYYEIVLSLIAKSSCAKISSRCGNSNGQIILTCFFIKYTTRYIVCLRLFCCMLHIRNQSMNFEYNYIFEY